MTRGTASAIANEIEDEIRSGVREPGSQLSPVRELALERQIAPATVASAYRRLRDRGLVVGRGRQGSRVAPRLQRSHTNSNPTPDLIDAATGTPDDERMPDVAQALTVAVSFPSTRYGDPMLTAELARAGRLSFDADGLDTTHFTITSGSMDAVERVLRAQGLRTGDRVGIEDPGHVPVHQVVRTAGFVAVPLPIDEQGLTPAGLETALEDGLSALIVTPRAQNPTGAALTPARALALSEVVSNYPNVVVILDDHAGNIAGVPFYPVQSPGDRWAVIRSVGKSFGPDLRVALVIGDEVTTDRVTTGIAIGPGWVSSVLQRSVAHLLESPEAARVIADAERSYKARRRLLIDQLNEYGIQATGESGLNVWIPTDDEQGLVTAAAEAGFAIRAAEFWRIDSAPAVRVTIANLTHDQIDQLAVALGAHVSMSSSGSVV